MYDPQVGRFISVDPLGHEAGDTNHYRYVHNDPMNHTDPTGMTAIKDAQDYIDANPTSMALEKFMLDFLRRRGVKMSSSYHWLSWWEGTKDSLSIHECKQPPEHSAYYLTQAMREWAYADKNGMIEVAREFALKRKAEGGDTSQVLGWTLNFIHHWSKYPVNQKDQRPSMMDSSRVGEVYIWVFAGRGLIAGTTKAMVNVTKHGKMSKYYYDTTAGKLNPTDDQTHHFAAYFALGSGFNGSTYLGGLNLIKSLDTPGGNPGDYLNGVVGRSLGESYHNNPRKMGKEIIDSLRKDPEEKGSLLWDQAISNYLKT